VSETASVLRVSVNGEAREVPAGCTLALLLKQMEAVPEAVATAINGDFVPRSERAARVLREGDAVMCFQPITGG
jgi:sulfur carrier protein